MTAMTLPVIPGVFTRDIQNTAGRNGGKKKASLKFSADAFLCGRIPAQ
jgi:hypothetical protein